MSIPKLKRIKISCERDLRNWLAKHPEPARGVMVVTCNVTSRDKYVSRDQVSGVLATYGWDIGRSYTLIGDLVGHVARRQ